MAVLLAIAVYLSACAAIDVAHDPGRQRSSISLLALACLGRRFAFAHGLLALMLSYDGLVDARARPVEGGRTRSYFGIYEVYERPDGTARVLTHGTTLHGIQNLDPGAGDASRPPIMPAAPASASRSTNADSLFGADPRIGVVGLGTGTLSCYA